jgi:2-aminoadipate transaminase
VAPRPLIARLVIAKQAADLHTDGLVQRAVLHYFTHNDVDGHVERLCAVYRERRDAMLAALERYFPSEARWTRPAGGLFLWVTLPEGVDARSLLAAALEERVAFVPGNAFHVDGGGRNALRLNFSHATPERLEEGVRRLAGVVEEHLYARAR